MPGKLILAACVATITLAFATSTVSARNLSISHGGLFNATFRPLVFRSSGTTAASCDVTVEGSFHYTTAAKVRESLIGYVSRALVNNCTAGGVTVLTTNLPWHIRYHSFEGTLPNISAIRVLILLVEFQTRDAIFGTICLSRTTNTEPGIGAVRLSAGNERRLVTGLTADSVARIRCGELSGAFEGTARVTELPGGATNILVRLI